MGQVSAVRKCKLISHIHIYMHVRGSRIKSRTGLASAVCCSPAPREEGPLPLPPFPCSIGGFEKQKQRLPGQPQITASGHNRQIQDQLSNSDNPDHILERAGRQDPQLSRHILPQPACNFLAGVHVYLGTHPWRALAPGSSSYPTNRQKTILRPLVISSTDRSFVTVTVSSSSKTGAPLGWPVLRLWRCVAPSPQRVAT